MRQQRPPARLSRQVECRSCAVRQVSAIGLLEERELDRLEGGKTTRQFATGQYLFMQGHPCTGVYCIETGSVALRRADASGNSLLARVAGPGETIGYRDFFAGREYQVTADPLQTTVACHIPNETLRELLAENAALGWHFLKHLAEDADDAEGCILNNLTLPVRTRLAHQLLSFRERFGEVDDGGNLLIRLPVQRQDLASMLGTRPETIARAIHALEVDGVARFNGRAVLVPDLDLLLDELEASVA